VTRDVQALAALYCLRDSQDDAMLELASGDRGLQPGNVAILWATLQELFTARWADPAYRTHPTAAETHWLGLLAELGMRGLLPPPSVEWEVTELPPLYELAASGPTSRSVRVRVVDPVHSETGHQFRVGFQFGGSALAGSDYLISGSPSANGKLIFNPGVTELGVLIAVENRRGARGRRGLRDHARGAGGLPGGLAGDAHGFDRLRRVGPRRRGPAAAVLLPE
jgi:hypothetical protein